MNATLYHVNSEDYVSTNKIGDPLDTFKLFYEEITGVKNSPNRIRRVRQAKANA